MVEGGTAHGWNRSTDQLVSRGAPLPPYIKEKGGRRPARRRARQGGSSTPTGSRNPPFPCWSRRGKEGREEEKEKGGAAPILVQFRLEGNGVHGCPGCPSSSPTKAHEAQLTPRGVR